MMRGNAGSGKWSEMKGSMGLLRGKKRFTFKTTLIASKTTEYRSLKW